MTNEQMARAINELQHDVAEMKATLSAWARDADEAAKQIDALINPAVAETLERACP